MTRRAGPYAVAVGGAVAITLLLELFASYVSAASLSTLYLLLVLWLGARWGRGAAVTGSIAAFLLYDFFFVPPVGTFSVRGPAEFLELAVLLAVALVTSQLAASQRLAQSTAEALARDSRALYDLATSMLKANEVSPALTLVCESALQLASVGRFAVVADGVRLAGSPLTADELNQAAWSHDHAQAVGIAVKDGAVIPMKTHGAGSKLAYLPLTSGVVALEVGPESWDEAESRMLAAHIGLAGLLLDRRRASVESERARGFQASDRLKAAILSSMSHELKSPIAALRAGLTALATPKAGLEPEQRELLGDLDRQATRLDRMVGDLLALSRLEAGVGIETEPHSFAEIVGASVREMRAQLRGREVTVRIPDDLPPVEVDDTQLGRVVGNLLENAADWAPAGARIEVGAILIDDHIEAWVENDGPAIDPNDLDRVFDTFWSRRASGTGLGLAIAKRVVEAHGGTITAENRRRGPRFTFTLPLAHVAVSG
jgi:two-component system, OmpR family, sensor histidine kinase KdpD